MAGFTVPSWHARRAAVATGAATLFAAGFAGGLGLMRSGGSDRADTPVGATAPAAAAPAAAAAQPPAAPLLQPADATRYLPLYHQAARRFGVNWLLIASIHSQETAFSTAADTYHGLNFARCCAGPMQFNVKNGKPSTWVRFRGAYAQGRRPASYPHATARHPSVYDDYDAIMAAGSLLAANGAGRALDGTAWSAAYQYYGPGDVAAVDYANQVLARASVWQQSGFDAQTAPDPALVASFEAAYGAALRDQLTAKPAAKPSKQHDKHASHATKRREHKQAPVHHHRHPPPPAPHAHRPAPRRHPSTHSPSNPSESRPSATSAGDGAVVAGERPAMVAPAP